jgi:hypothetical protein
MILSRRNFFVGLGALFAAPAIIPYERLMPVKAIILPKQVIRYFQSDGTLIYEAEVPAGNPHIWTPEIVCGVPLTSLVFNVEVASV